MAPRTNVIFFKGTQVISEVYTVDDKGLRQGECVRFHESGALIEKCHYHNGKKEGAFKTYFLNGAVATRGTYRDSQLIGKYEEFYENGQIKKRAKYCDEPYYEGSLKGRICQYYENGQLKSKYFYCLGCPKGTFYEFYENGQLKIKGRFNKKSELDGPYEEYTKNGGLIRRGKYYDGRQLGPWAWVTEDERDEAKMKAELMKEKKIKSQLDELGLEMRELLVMRLDALNNQMKPTQLRQVAKRQLVRQFHERCQKYMSR